MEIIITIGTLGILVIFGAMLWKFLTHPATGKIQYYYRDKYHENYRKTNIPPFY